MGGRKKQSQKHPAAGRIGRGAESREDNLPGLKKVSLALIIVLLAIGIGAAWYLAMVKLRLQYHPEYISDCNYSQTVNCDTVQTSDQSEIFGIPIALLGIATYVAMMVLAILAAIGGRHRPKALSALFSVGLATCLYSLYLAIISLFVIKAVCTYCILMYAVSVLVTLVSFLSLPGPLRSILSAATFFSPFLYRPVILGIAVSFWVSLGTVYGIYHGKKNEMIAHYIQKTGTAMASSKSSTVDDNPPPGVTTAETDLVPVMTGRGMSFMKFSVTEDDHVKGPADAPVTIVLFADFNCSYCRKLSKEIVPLENKYQGKSRWVFKHFPLDQECNQHFLTTHPNACKGSRAVFCASEQGKFWEAHDYFFDKPSDYSDQALAHMVTALDLDQGRFNECLGSNRPDAKIARDVQDGYKARLSGTPRTYINGYLLSGSVGVEIMDYYIQKALTQATDSRAIMTVPVAPSSRTPPTVLLKTTDKPFYIDAFEAAIDRQGRAVSLPGVRPAYASWQMAKSACEKAGKRLCTEAEWVTACTGVPAVDNNKNGYFTDDDIEGWMFPYGPYYIGGRCYDNAPEEDDIKITGSHPGCISVQGVYDLTGNLSEWAVSETGTPVLLGGHLRLGQKATCAFAINSLGPGIRNEVTGFRCCSDKPVPRSDLTPEDIEEIPLGGRVGKPIMDFSLIDQDGREINENSLSTGVTVVTICKARDVPGKLEMESLQQLKEELEPRGIRFLLFIVDRDAKESAAAIATLPFKGSVHLDTDQVSMGVFSVRKLPSTYVVDGQGILRVSSPGGMWNAADMFKDDLLTVAGLAEQ